MAAAPGGGAALSMLHLYRHILRAARDFPSVKKASIIREIKAEFRANRVRATREGEDSALACSA